MANTGGVTTNRPARTRRQPRPRERTLARPRWPRQCQTRAAAKPANKPRTRAKRRARTSPNTPDCGRSM
eukprot:11184433-Lingulodinium_polyedra.AAC.1